MKRWSSPGSIVACAVVWAACGNFNADPTHAPAPTDCPPGQTLCGETCFDLQATAGHCGQCATACAPSETCNAGQCATQCPAGQSTCGGACVDPESDAQNCGSCGKTCAEKEQCLAGACVFDCKKGLNQPFPNADPWGASWDGLERAATSFAAAKKVCEDINGRIPTPSELLRVSAVRSASVGQTRDTNYLWSLAPYSATGHVSLRLSDATSSMSLDTAALNYRCTCPPTPEVAYAGKSCFGPPGAACVALTSDGGRYNFDAEDRATVSKGAAIWECAFHHGHLATPVQYVEAMTQGAIGSGEFAHAADDVRYDLSSVLAWTAPATFVLEFNGTNASSASWSDAGTARPFRCAGPSYAAGTHPVTFTDEFVGAGSRYKSNTTDSPPLVFVPSEDACFARGGHLPTRAELATLVGEGLPNGSNDYIWTSDQVGYNGAQYLVADMWWVGAPNAFQYVWNIDMGWDYRTPSAAAHPSRCIYYPIDAVYTGPATAACSGGCFPVKAPGTSNATMWFDTSDRTPAETLTNAIRKCQLAGGRLPSERDLTEAIKSSLPNGSGNLIWTSDLELNAAPTLTAGVVHWSGIEPAFGDQYDGVTAGSSLPSTARAYRCMWTNELR